MDRSKGFSCHFSRRTARDSGAKCRVAHSTVLTRVCVDFLSKLLTLLITGFSPPADAKDFKMGENKLSVNDSNVLQRKHTHIKKL